MVPEQQDLNENPNFSPEKFYNRHMHQKQKRASDLKRRILQAQGRQSSVLRRQQQQQTLQTMHRESSNEVQPKARLPILYEESTKPGTQHARNANYLSRQHSEVKIKQGPILRPNQDLHDYGQRNESSSVEMSPA